LSLLEFLGFIAGALVTSSFIPQLIRVFKLKSTHEISTLFTILLLLGGITWLIYGIFFRLVPIIFWNAIATILIVILLYAKLRYSK